MFIGLLNIQAERAFSGLSYGAASIQLKYSQSSKFIAARFAMEIALLARLNEYDERIGLPRFPMPDPDGRGGVRHASAVPPAWSDG